MSIYLGPKPTEEHIYYASVIDAITTLTPIAATVGYVVTRLFTSYNPVAGATFFGAAVVGRIVLQPYFHNPMVSGTSSQIVGASLNYALAVFAATRGTPYVQDGIDFVASCVPSMPSIPSISSIFAGIKETFASLSVESVKTAVSEHPYAVAGATVLFALAYLARRRSNKNKKGYEAKTGGYQPKLDKQ